MAKVKRFVVFAYPSYYPSGGWDDTEGSYDTMEEALEAARALREDWREVVDLETGEVTSLD